MLPSAMRFRSLTVENNRLSRKLTQLTSVTSLDRRWHQPEQ
jgi:hypothetical protein